VSLSAPLHIMARGTFRPISTTELIVSPSPTVSQGTFVTLSAKVLDAGYPVRTGLVLFYSSTSAYPGETVVGQGQLTPSGVATMKFRPPAGSLGFKAVYQGTNTLAASESAPQSLSVTANIATSTAISVDPPTYSAEVTAYGPLAATGEVTFVDATDSNLKFATAPLGSANSQFSLTSAPSPNIGSGQYTMKVADFNGDGILDVAVVAGGLTILLGNPDGTFTQKSTTSLSGVVRDIAVADFNGDGNPDIAVLQDDEPSTVAVFLGRGDGTFISQPPIPVFSFFGAYSMASGDFNGDGNADLLVTNYNDGTTTVLLGNGDGGFLVKPGPDLGGQDSSAAIVADFNGDGIPDVATLDMFAEEYAFNVEILFGNGDGTFVVSSVPAQCDPNSGIAEADFNGDGFPDIVVGPCGSSVNMLLGNGNTTFTSMSVPVSQIGEFLEPNYEVTGDLNGDGIPDLVLVNTAGSEIGIMLGKGDGTFLAGPVLTLAGGAWAGEAAVADFNGDGIPDLLSPATNSFWFQDDQNVTNMFEWFSSISQASQATATNVTLPGNGTQQVFALYPGDLTHIGSVSVSVPAAAAELTPKQQ
jgi:hypothetical protein